MGIVTTGVIVLILTIALGAALAYQRVDLMSDYRAGYSAGGGLSHKVRYEQKPCNTEVSHVYGNPLDQRWSDSEHAFFLGCFAAYSGLENNYWHVKDYLHD